MKRYHRDKAKAAVDSLQRLIASLLEPNEGFLPHVALKAGGGQNRNAVRASGEYSNIIQGSFPKRGLVQRWPNTLISGDILHPHDERMKEYTILNRND